LGTTGLHVEDKKSTEHFSKGGRSLAVTKADRYLCVQTLEMAMMMMMIIIIIIIIMIIMALGSNS
jgi:hypothetical protein